LTAVSSAGLLLPSKRKLLKILLSRRLLKMMLVDQPSLKQLFKRFITVVISMLCNPFISIIIKYYPR
jgi:hypothetical protein